MKIRSSSFSKKNISMQLFLIAGGLVSMSAQGMVPVEFGQWTASAYTISATCPSNYKCSVEVSDKNFYQEIMQETDGFGNVISGGKKFFRQIINENDMVSESIVRANNIQSAYARHGIANKQSLTMSQTKANAMTNFSTGTTLYSGWASSTSTPHLQINQNIDETSRKAGEGGVYLEGKFNSATTINANYDAKGKRTGFSFAVDQSLEEPGQYGASSSDSSWDSSQDSWSSWDNSSSTTSAYSEIDSQVFAMRGLEGDLLTSAGSLSLDGNSLSWNAGDSLWGHAIGQNFHHTSLTGEGSILDDGSSPAGYEDLGVMFESYDNRSDNDVAVNYFAYFKNNVTGWPTVFGVEPDLPAPTGINGGSSTGSGPSPTLVSSLFTPTAVGPEQVDGRDTPIAFNQWTVEGGTLTVEGLLAEPIDVTSTQTYPSNWVPGDDGTILPECAVGVLCETGIVVTPGMIQRVVTDADGKRYIQTILTDLNTGFSTESFVSIAATATLTGSRNGIQYTGGFNEDTAENGISMRMILSEDTSRTGVTGTMDTEVIIHTGWAAKSGAPNVAISQNLDESGPLSSSFNQQFTYNGNLDTEGNTIGSLLNIDQQAINTSAAFNGSHGTSINDSLKFVHRSRAGNLQTNSGGISSIDWNAGDAISATWLSNSFDRSDFGVVFYDNLVDSLAYVDLGWDRDRYNGLGSNWISSAFGNSPDDSSSSTSTNYDSYDTYDTYNSDTSYSSTW